MLMLRGKSTRTGTSSPNTYPWKVKVCAGTALLIELSGAGGCRDDTMGDPRPGDWPTIGPPPAAAARGLNDGESVDRAVGLITEAILVAFWTVLHVLSSVRGAGDRGGRGRARAYACGKEK